jgi:membrane associated rhomboid family serine protease
MNKKSIISASKTTGLAIAGCVAAFVILAIQIAIFGEKSSGILLLDPIISGFLHTGISHFVFNMVLLAPTANS